LKSITACGAGASNLAGMLRQTQGISVPRLPRFYLAERGR
jgi:hypothetical protein